MRILSALIITYCCGCVAPESTNEKRDDPGTLKNSLSPDITVQIGSKESPMYNNYQRRSRRHAEELKLRRRSRCHSHPGKVTGAHAHGHNSRITSSNAPPEALDDDRQTEDATDEKDDETEDKNDTENNDYVVEWDDWGEWTKCTVTCGNGRQVRWRHCISENCPAEGLKRAQLRTCHFEDCPSKGVLGWLGLRT